MAAIESIANWHFTSNRSRASLAHAHRGLVDRCAASGEEGEGTLNFFTARHRWQGRRRPSSFCLATYRRNRKPL